MNENEEDKQFFSDENLGNDKLYIEIPAEQQSPYQERIPSGYDPMQEIYLRGRAFRSMSGGGIPWWVLISGWLIFGGLALLMLITAIASQSFELLFPLVIISIPVLIVCRGTLAKLSNNKRRKR